MKIQKNKNLKNLNSYQLKTRAKYFVEVKNKNNILEISDFIQKEKIKKYFILAGGSNVIFLDEFYDGLVIKISNNYTRWKNKNIVKVGAGRILDNFLNSLQKRKIYSIQNLSLIPGSIGGAVFGNAGAFGQEIKNFIQEVGVFDLKEKKWKNFKYQELDFSYRNSFFKKNPDRFLIYSVIFNFSKKEILKKQEKNHYFSLKDFAKKHKIKKLKEKDIRKNIIKIRKNIYPNLKLFPNVGSTFKNAEIDKKIFQKIQKKFPDIPFWNLENGKIKIPTAYIFDKILNLNGKQFGNILIDKKRPLFFINTGKASGKEFYQLCQKIIKTTEREIGVKLETEVIFVK